MYNIFEGLFCKNRYLRLYLITYIFVCYFCVHSRELFIYNTWEVMFQIILHNGINFKAFLEIHPSSNGVAVSHFATSCAYVWVKVSVEDHTFTRQVSFFINLNSKVCLESGVRILLCLCNVYKWGPRPHYVLKRHTHMQLTTDILSRRKKGPKST
jgi:hypothetical protein